MATNKTINPTNVTVQIPAMADKPNQAVNSNCLDKIIDGVNTLNSKVTPTATPSGSPFTLRKIGNLVFMDTANAIIPSDYVIPSGYRPNDYTVYGTMLVVNNDSWGPGAIKIATDGTITVEYVPGGTASTRQIAGSLMWVTA